jgi:hypothetical protein
VLASSLITGSIKSQIGLVRRRKDEDAVRIESFSASLDDGRVAATLRAAGEVAPETLNEQIVMVPECSEALF